MNTLSELIFRRRVLGAPWKILPFDAVFCFAKGKVLFEGFCFDFDLVSWF